MITAGRQRRQQVLQPNGVVSTVKAREGKKSRATLRAVGGDDKPLSGAGWRVA
jgi:hypothetical protein